MDFYLDEFGKLEEGSPHRYQAITSLLAGPKFLKSNISASTLAEVLRACCSDELHFIFERMYPQAENGGFVNNAKDFVRLYQAYQVAIIDVTYDAIDWGKKRRLVRRPGQVLANMLERQLQEMFKQLFYKEGEWDRLVKTKDDFTEIYRILSEIPRRLLLQRLVVRTDAGLNLAFGMSLDEAQTMIKEASIKESMMQTYFDTASDIKSFDQLVALNIEAIQCVSDASDFAKKYPIFPAEWKKNYFNKMIRR